MFKSRGILDHGEVELVSHTEDGDLLVINAARCSFDKQHKEWDDDKDDRLINFLAKEKHLLPFRHPHATLRITAPIFVFRQLMKHNVGFSWSEVSRRYITTEPKFYTPEQIRTRPDNIKQGSVDKEWDSKTEGQLHRLFDGVNTDSLELYNNLLDSGVAPEQARTVLPQSMFTTTVVTGSLLGWWHLVKMRTDDHAQFETRQFAYSIGDIMSSIYPEAWRALRTHNA